MILTRFFIVLTSITYSFAKLSYPCECDDALCIRRNLFVHSKCDRDICGSIPSEFQRQNVEFQVPITNATYLDQYILVRNVDQCYVSAFFYNVSSNVLVMSVKCPNLQAEVNRTIIQHYPNALNEFYTAKICSNLPPVTFTANLQHADDIDLCDEDVYTYLDGLPTITSIEPVDDESRNFISNDCNGAQKNLDIFNREELLVLGPPVFRYYVNNMLCDFQCSAP